MYTALQKTESANPYSRRKNTYLKYLDIVQICIYLFSLVSVLNAIKTNKFNHTNSILLIVFVGGFLFHILWETKSIYVVPYYMMLLPSAADGIEVTNEFISTNFNKLLVKIKSLKKVK